VYPQVGVKVRPPIPFSVRISPGPAGVNRISETGVKGSQTGNKKEKIILYIFHFMLQFPHIE
jgi:hypothetical protein